MDVPVVGRQDEIRLWSYHNRLSRVPQAATSRTVRWIFPADTDLAHPQLSEVRVWQQTPGASLPNGVARAGTHRGDVTVVPIASGPARIVTVSFAFAYRLPKRYGRLGRAAGQITLAAPWYPLAMHSSMHRATHRVQLEAEGEVIVGRCSGVGRARCVTRGLYPASAAAERFHRYSLDDGMELWSAKSLYQRPSASPHLSSLHDPLQVDKPARVKTQLNKVRQVCASLHLPCPLVKRVVVVPSRLELAAPAEDWLIVSDRLYEVFPVRQVRGFHSARLRLALYESIARKMWSNDESWRDLAWGAELRAEALMRIDAAHARHKMLRPRELLSFAAFHPAVDQLLYASQVVFPEVYFGSASAPNQLVDDPVKAGGKTGLGHRIFENLAVRLPRPHFARLVNALVSKGRSARDTIAAESRRSSVLLETWLRSNNTSVNYTLAGVTSRRVKAGYASQVVIRRTGGEHADPVEVRVVTKDGKSYGATWEGTSSKGLVEVVSKHPPARVDLDPNHRIYQSPEVAEGHPLADDTTHLPWRPPLLQSFALNASLADRLVTGFIDIALRKKYNLEDALALRAEHTASTTGLAARYIRGVGPKVHNNRRMGYVTLGAFGERLRSGFLEETNRGAWGYGVSFGAGFDTRSFFADPREGTSLSFGGQMGLVDPAGMNREPSVSGGIRGTHTLALGLRHVWVFVAGAGVTLGSSAPGRRQSLGGRFTLRGYEVDELLGVGRFYGVMEHRWTVSNDLHLNALHLSWVRELQLAAFAGGGLLAGREEASRPAAAAEVGAGVRFHHEYGGVQPAVLALDVARPLIRDQEGRAVRAPVNVYLSFDQFF